MRFDGLRIFHDATAVDRLALQIQMVGGDDDTKPTNKPKVAVCPPKVLADAIEEELKAGRASTCSEALRLIAATRPHLIDRASDFKNSVESDSLTAESRYFAQVREIQIAEGLSRSEVSI